MRISSVDLRHLVDFNYLGRWVPLSILIGIIAGIGAIVFYEALRWATHLMLGLGAGYFPPQPAGEGPSIVRSIVRLWFIPVITTLGGLLSGFIVYRFAPEAEGHGTDAAIDAFHYKNGYIRRRIPVVKMAASVITIGSGGSAGREGPIAQIAAGFGSLISDLFKLTPRERRIAVVVGIGAGIGAIFKAPLGGALFGSEVLYRRDFEMEAIMPAFIASVVGYSIFALWHGWTPIFGTGSPVSFHRPQELISYALLGIACGLMGILYARTFYWFRDQFRRLSIPQFMKPALGGLGVGIIGLFLPQVLGMGYGWLQLAIEGDFTTLPLSLMAGIMVGKIVATGLSIGSGGSGGVFAPGLVVGGMTGGVVWGLLDKMDFPFIPAIPAAFVVVGMMSLFGGIAKAPLAVIIMVSEMTGDYALLVPSMIAVAIAYLITGPYSIYESQVPSRARSPAHKSEYSLPLLEGLYVHQAMTSNLTTISPNASVADAAELLKERKIDAIPVIENDNLVGIVATLDVALVPPGQRAAVKVRDIMSRNLVVTYPDETLYQALYKMSQRDVSHLPVVDRNAPQKILGILATSDITRVYTLEVKVLHEEAAQ